MYVVRLVKSPVNPLAVSFLHSYLELSYLRDPQNPLRDPFKIPLKDFIRDSAGDVF